MDPNAVVEEIERGIAEGDAGAAALALGVLTGWLDRGGFWPDVMAGDESYRTWPIATAKRIAAMPNAHAG